MQQRSYPLAALALVVVLIQTLAPGQAPSQIPGRVPSRVPVGYVSERFDNPAKTDAKRLSALVFYAAKKNGQETPVLPKKGGYPVVVVLHGLGGRALIMYAMASQLVQAGYIVVANDTGQFDPEAQARDATALFQAMVAENKNKESEFKGQLDMSRAGICGHSMGGGNTVRVLADNPGYKAGFCFAPWGGKILPNSKAIYVDRYAAKVTTPLGIVHGTGDRILAWRDHAHRYLEAMKETPASKFLYLLNDDCDHINVAVAGPLSSKRAKAVFYNSVGLAVAFFDCHLRNQPEALDKILGKDAKKNNPRLEKLIFLAGKK